MIVRRAQIEDAETLHRHCYPEASPDDVRDYLAWCLRPARQGRIVRLVVEVDGQAVGNAQLTVWGQQGEIGSLVIAEAYRRQGLARRLLIELIHEAKQRGLVALEIEVSESHQAILAFYERLGFRRTVDEREELSRSASPKPRVHLEMHL